MLYQRFILRLWKSGPMIVKVHIGKACFAKTHAIRSHVVFLSSHWGALQVPAADEKSANSRRPHKRPQTWGWDVWCANNAGRQDECTKHKHHRLDLLDKILKLPQVYTMSVSQTVL